jgi:tetratricopeptide (TPR) repeat protein
MGHRHKIRKFSRRSFLQGMRWSSIVLLPAPLHSAFLWPNLGRPASENLSDLPLTDSRYKPRYPSKSPLDDILRCVEPGTDEYISEKYAAEIAEVLRGWSEELSLNPASLQKVEKSLDPSFKAASPTPIHEKTLRSGAIAVSRRLFSSEATLGSEQFLAELHRSFASLKDLETAELQIVAISQIGSSPLRVRLEVRYDFVGRLGDVACEERIGRWLMEWMQSDARQWKLALWVATAETFSRAAQPVFMDITVQALGETVSYKNQLRHGMDYWRTVLDGATGINVYGNSGIAAGDFDNDGFDDLYVSQPAGLPNRLYRNRSDGTFEDVTETAGVGVLDETACAIFADFENRGLQDLLVVTATGPLLFTNQGNGKFAHKADAFQFATPPSGTFTHAAVADYDGDGRLDVYFCLYSYYFGLEQYHYPVPYFDARNGPPNFLFHNEGNGLFRDRTKAAGLDVENDRYSFACIWGDYDADGHPDLYVVNDFGRNNLYRNNGHGTFTAVSASARVDEPGAGMSACWLDFNNDGKQDIYSAGMWVPAGLRVFDQAPFHAAEPETIRSLYRRHMSGNSLYLNKGDGQFQNVAPLAGVEVGRWSWSTDSWDFDHDGYSDLYVANGYISGPGDLDVSSFFWRQVVAKSPPNATPSERYERGWNAINELIRSDAAWNGLERNIFYLNNRDGTFSEITGIVGLDLLDDSRSFALTDLDGDGRLEIVLKNRTGPQIRILRNCMRELGASIAFRLHGNSSNRDAIGAAVALEVGTLRQTKYLQAGSGFLSQHTKELFFGIGEINDGMAVRASVRWPSGSTQTFDALPVNHRIEIYEGVSEFHARSFSASPVVNSKVRETYQLESLPESVDTWLVQPLPAPEFSLPDLSGATKELRTFYGDLALLHFWTTTTPSCREQLIELQAHRETLANGGLRVVCINVDDHQEDPQAIRSFAAQERITLPIVLATPEVAGVYNLLYRYLFDRRRDLPVPLSFLLNREGAIVKVYQGLVRPEQLLADAGSIPSTAVGFIDKALPFKGKVFQERFQRNDLTYAVALFQHGYLGQAAVEFKKVISAKPDDATAYYNLGTLYLRMDRLPDSREYLDQAVKLRPDYAEAWNNLGMIAAKNGQEEEAIRDFQRSLTIRPTYETALVNLGNLLRRKGSLGDAKELLERAVQVSPDDPEASYSLGMLYAKQNQFQPAADYLGKALALRPDYVDALNNLGVLFARQEKYAEAQQEFENCIRIAPNFDQAYINLARVYVVLNEKEKAREILQALLRQQPENKVARQTLEMLN